MLGLPVVTLVKKINQINEKHIRVERIFEVGFQIVDVAIPCVLTISNEVGELRYPTIKQITAAAREPIIRWKAIDLGLDTALSGPSVAKVKTIKLSMPKYRTNVEIVTGENPEDSGVRLARRLWKSGAIPNT